MKNLLILLSTTLLLLTSCTDNTMARKYGGTETIKLTPNQKLVNVTWKEDELWYLTREMKSDETAEIYKFQEKSSFGIIEGVVVIKETK